MGALQTPVIYPANHAKLALAGSVNAYRPKVMMKKPFLGFDGSFTSQFKLCVVPNKHQRRDRSIQCTFSLSSNGNGSTSGNFNEDEEYVNSSIVEAVEVKSGSDGFLIKMGDGRHVRCVHNNPQGGHLPDYAPQPAIVLKWKMEVIYFFQLLCWSCRVFY